MGQIERRRRAQAAGATGRSGGSIGGRGAGKRSGKGGERAVGARSGKPLRLAKALARRDAILDAALEEFAAAGFAAARLDDVARRAGVAKGTIYLHFKDKQSLFQELIRAKMGPVVGALETAFVAELPLRAIFDHAASVLIREVFGTPRKQVIRLIISEGARFPALAEFYYREVLTRIISAVRKLLRRGFERGELASDALVRFPQLLGAPLVVALIWTQLFDRFEPLAVDAMMRAYVDLLFAGRGRP